jgi:phage gpG-like protein
MSKEYPHPFKKMYDHQVRIFKRLPLRMSQWGLLEIKENFERGGYYDSAGHFVPWKKRSAKTWSKKSNDEGRALLVLKGRLKRSFRPSPLYNEARVTTDVPYAEAHQKGSTKTITQKVKSFTRKKGKRKAIVKAHTRKVKMNIPARPFMEVGGTALRQWENKVLTEIEQLFLKS